MNVQSREVGMWGVTWTAMLLSLLWAMPAEAQGTLEDLRAKAIQGDFDAQRDLAGCLGEEPGECPIEPTPNPVKACTWRMIIVTSEHSKITDADREAYGRDCSFQTISQLEQAAALAEAQRLFSEVYKRDMPVKQLLQTGR